MTFMRTQSHLPLFNDEERIKDIKGLVLYGPEPPPAALDSHESIELISQNAAERYNLNEISLREAAKMARMEPVEFFKRYVAKI
jgi:hypothetical protein